MLHQLVQEHLETFLALADDPTRLGVPGYVERDFRKYLDCGILACGFVRARCKDCGRDYLIAFSCKARGACPSCNTRAQAVEIAAHPIDRVIPPPRIHRHRYYGVLVPNALLRPAVAAPACREPMAEPAAAANEARG